MADAQPTRSFSGILFSSYHQVATETSRYLSDVEEKAVAGATTKGDERALAGDQRMLARSNPKDWWYPTSVESSNVKWISGTGR